MVAGKLLVILSFVMTVISGWFYFISSSKKQSKDKIDIARTTYYLMTGFISLASFYLLYLIITHNFQVSYIYRYSSSDLPFGLLLSTFWAGQEGSFLFWALLIAWLGVFFVRTAKQYESWGMFFANIIQAFFLLILIKASPFELMQHTPSEGGGLNPLLQNFWMVIHPPILFIGYAAATYLISLSLAALMSKDNGDWLKQAMPWSLFVSITLGAGIIIGGFWSYETLGWGGYWGWDPVENSSLIPWLIVLALFHGLLIERKTGSLSKTNHFLSILTFLLIIYATFLTRSGVLEDFSVHSFQNLGINGYLIVFMLVSLAGSIAIFLSRFRNLPGKTMDFSNLNKENILLGGLWLFAASGTLTFFGTSSPIITGLFGTASQVDISYYNKVNFPVGLGMALLLGLAPMFNWTDKNNKAAFKKLLIPVILSVAGVLFAIYRQLGDMADLLFLFLALFTFWSNLVVFFTKVKNNWQTSGAAFAHVGLGIMFVGIIISARFDETTRIVLNQGEKSEALGYVFNYVEFAQKNDGKHEVIINVMDGNSSFTANPRIYFSDMNQGMMREPYVEPGFITDLYLAPLERRAQQSSGLTLLKGEEKKFGNLTLKFLEFEMGSHAETNEFTVGAKLKISANEKTEEIIPRMIMAGGNRKTMPAPIAILGHDGETHPAVILTGLNADDKSISIEFSGINPAGANQSTDQLLLEVSKKPFMSILWVGTIILTLGTVVSFKRRLNKTEIPD